MNVYVATSSKNIEGFAQAKEKLEAAGHKITHDWTKEIVSQKNDLTGEKLNEFLAQCAATDVIGVYMADILLVLPTTDFSAGMMVEFGLGIGMYKRVIVVDAFGEGKPDCIFFNLPRVPQIHEHVKTLDEAIDLIKPYEQPAPVVPGNN